ncbi:hypothetical protein ADUPG1_009121 [Aduncisulcus paluster]|uniref:HMG box domain-containing protein n=1 Tax=Aduncisulcus paluster TaxID=2918883 RepID=A0ABQ5KUF7_9EUKA|nr:hypothetical protein ADUPG1_009121 [Aduncisulcus paluster]
MAEVQPPKKPLNGYMLYTQDHRKEFVAAHPEMSITEIGKAMGKIWNGLPEAERNPYVSQYKKAYAEYEKKMAIFKKENPEWKPVRKVKIKKTDISQPVYFEGKQLFVVSVFRQLHDENEVSTPSMTAKRMIEKKWSTLTKEQKHAWNIFALKLYDEAVKKADEHVKKIKETQKKKKEGKKKEEKKKDE